MTLKMIQNLGNTMEKIQETFNKDLEELKSKQTMMNNIINEIKNSLEGINSRITEAEEWRSNLEDKIAETTTAEQNKENRMKTIEDSLRDPWDNIKCIQCNPYQTTNGIFHRTRTKNFTVCMKTQKTPNSQSKVEKEKQSWRNMAP